MKKLLLTSLMLTSCACFAHVRSGANNTYTVDSYGDREKYIPHGDKDKINFLPENEVLHCEKFKAKGLTVLY